MAFRWRANDGPLLVTDWIFLGILLRISPAKQSDPLLIPSVMRAYGGPLLVTDWIFLGILLRISLAKQSDPLLFPSVN